RAVRERDRRGGRRARRAHRPRPAARPARLSRGVPGRAHRLQDRTERPMRLDIVTIFPEYFAPLDVSLLGKARRRGDVDARGHALRDWAHARHRTVDDTPYGGGPGRVMKPEPWGEALDAIAPPGSEARLVVPTPSGRPFTQEIAVAYAAEPWLVFACGR